MNNLYIFLFTAFGLFLVIIIAIFILLLLRIRDSLGNSIRNNIADVRTQVNQALNNNAAMLDKSNTIFTDVVKHLALIDNAQKRITELSSNVVNLQELLTDKRSRGAFGETQLAALIRNILPEKHFALQHTLSNGKRADCILFLPEPSGNIVIDAKFPLETFQRLSDINVPKPERNMLEQQFRIDINKHLQDIATKYIIPNETAEGAMMFIPAEAIFAEIHAHYPDLITKSHKLRVWMVSPTTMMAVLTTARAVLKDAATRNQVHIIQEHLNELGKDFSRFQNRMDGLAKHINQAQTDVELVHKSSQKISSRFNKIENVELAEIPKIETR
jgi:DNA recombination protein RmuC